MRDILLTLIVACLVPIIMRRPEFGAYAWAWISMMNPHQLTYGFAQSIPFAMFIAILTIGTLIFNSRRKPLPINIGVVLLICLILWMTVTSVFSINDPQLVWDRWLFVIKIHAMLFVTMMLLRGRQQIDRLIWVIVISIGFYGVKGGIWTLATGGGMRVWGPRGMLEDNNGLAVGLVIIFPLMYYLYNTSRSRWIRSGLIVSMLFTAFSILGSQSRGALLALLAMGLALGLKSKRPIGFTLVMATLVGLAVGFMPESWFQRMDTIQNYAAETSAMSRLYTWQTLWNVAVARPLVGAGFAADNAMIFSIYAPADQFYEVFQDRIWVAHSIYFQALGEHGFPGLILFVLLWAWIWRAAGRIAKQAEQMNDLRDWVPMLMRACQVSVLGFCAGGAFLSLMNLDLPYYLLAIVALTQCAVADKMKSALAPQGTGDLMPLKLRET